MQKLIPVIYFYLLSTVGMVLFIIGLFNAIHFIVGVTVYKKYPLRYNAESQCSYIAPSINGIHVLPAESEPNSDKQKQEECLQGLERERQNTKADDIEKSFAYTLIGLLVFASHFYFARKQRIA